MPPGARASNMRRRALRAPDAGGTWVGVGWVDAIFFVNLGVMVLVVTMRLSEAGSVKITR